MKKQNQLRCLFAAVAAGVMSALTVSATFDLPAPMPEFMDDAQLETWRNDQIAESSAREAAAQSLDPRPSTLAPFFTCKPLMEETGEYAFLYRNYNPELARWSSQDPNGFPDGANNLAYMAVPTSELDWMGLVTVEVTGTTGNVAPSPLGLNTIIDQKNVGAEGFVSANKRIVWTLDDPTFSGWIVQEAKLVFDIKNSTTQAKLEIEIWHYWEAWQVTNGVISPNAVDNFLTPSYSTTNTFRSIHAIGSAQLFVTNFDFSGNAPFSWSTSDIQYSGGLHATSSEPSWWSGGNVSHELKATWE